MQGWTTSTSSLSKPESRHQNLNGISLRKRTLRSLLLPFHTVITDREGQILTCKRSSCPSGHLAGACPAVLRDGIGHSNAEQPSELLLREIGDERPGVNRDARRLRADLGLGAEDRVHLAAEGASHLAPAIRGGEPRPRIRPDADR